MTKENCVECPNRFLCKNSPFYGIEDPFYENPTCLNIGDSK